MSTAKIIQWNEEFEDYVLDSLETWEKILPRNKASAQSMVKLEITPDGLSGITVDELESIFSLGKVNVSVRECIRNFHTYLLNRQIISD